MNLIKFSLIILIIAIPFFNIAAQPEVTVGDIELSRTKWGEMSIPIEISNNTDNLKFITIQIEINSQGATISSNKNFKTNTFLIPMESKIVDVKLNIPANFGQTDLKFTFYDVVDTLDELLPYQKIFEQPFFLKPRIPEEIYSYLNEKITLPPMVNNSPEFGFEFSRVLLLMIQEGKTVEEIADAAKVDVDIVIKLLSPLVKNNYIKNEQGKYSLNFPMITVDEAEISRQLALEVADYLSNAIKNDMPLYFNLRDSLVEAGLISADSNEFMNGGVITYNPYAVIGAFLLWYELGQNFITRNIPLIIYDNTNFCKAQIPYYMYAVQGGDVFNGSHFYSINFTKTNYQFQFGDSIPVFKCDDDRYKRMYIRWATNNFYDLKFNPEVFILDTNVIVPIVNAMGEKHHIYLTEVYNKLFKIADKFGHYKVTFGHRYWFWNLVATRTLEKLVSGGVLKRTGNGQFKMDGQQSKRVQ